MLPPISARTHDQQMPHHLPTWQQCQLARRRSSHHLICFLQWLHGTSAMEPELPPPVWQTSGDTRDHTAWLLSLSNSLIRHRLISSQNANPIQQLVYLQAINLNTAASLRTCEGCVIWSEGLLVQDLICTHTKLTAFMAGVPKVHTEGQRFRCLWL